MTRLDRLSPWVALLVGLSLSACDPNVGTLCREDVDRCASGEDPEQISVFGSNEEFWLEGLRVPLKDLPSIEPAWVAPRCGADSDCKGPSIADGRVWMIEPRQPGNLRQAFERFALSVDGTLIGSSTLSYALPAHTNIQAIRFDEDGGGQALLEGSEAHTLVDLDDTQQPTEIQAPWPNLDNLGWFAEGTPDGGYLLCDFGFESIHLWKIDAQGELVWTRSDLGVYGDPHGWVPSRSLSVDASSGDILIMLPTEYFVRWARMDSDGTVHQVMNIERNGSFENVRMSVQRDGSTVISGNVVDGGLALYRVGADPRSQWDLVFERHTYTRLAVMSHAALDAGKVVTLLAHGDREAERMAACVIEAQGEGVQCRDVGAIEHWDHTEPDSVYARVAVLDGTLLIYDGLNGLRGYELEDW